MFISLRLKVSVFTAVWMCTGRLFAFGAATLNIRCILGTCKSDHVAERRTVPQVVTGCSRSVMYDGVLPMRDRCTNRHSLNCMHALTGSQCSSIVVAETWSCGRRLYTSLKAALTTCYSGAMVTYGSPASRALL